MRAVRKLHVDSTRTEDTINRVFTEVGKSNKLISKLPDVVPPPTIDTLLMVP